MRQTLLLIGVSLAVLFSATVLAQEPVQVEFQINPVLVQTGTEIVFTVLTVQDVFTVTWLYKGVTLGLWSASGGQVNPVPQFLGRVTITKTQLRIGSAQRIDDGDYTATVDPFGSTGQAANSKSVQLKVFDAVAGLSLLVPSVAVEGRNVSLSCTWTAGTEIAVQWGKGGATITADSRITISGGSLIINPARRSDAGEYTCTASNPVSARTVTQSLTVYYGPDTPVLTVDPPKECVGGGNVLLGQTVRLTCISDSLPPALFSWQRDGQSVTTGQPDSGVLSLQTFSTNESGRYVCVARNSLTEGTSEQSTVLDIVDVCFSGGEVAGIVIGAFLALLIIILLIVIVICLVRRRRAQRRRDNMLIQKSNENPRPIPPDPQPNAERDLNQGPNPPLHTNTYSRHPDRLYTAAQENRGNPQTLQTNGRRNSDTHQHNGRTTANRLPHNAIQNSNSYPHNGIDNPAFTRTDDRNANTLSNMQQQTPNILIQTGSGQGGAQPPAVQVSLNALPQSTQPNNNNNNAQLPTINVNLNSYPNNGQDSSFPLNNTANNNNVSQTQHDPVNTPRVQSGLSYPDDSRMNNHTNHQPGLIPTGYTHYNSNNTLQRNANTQTYQQDPEPHRRADRNSRRPEAEQSPSHRQMPWDRLRGTPAYPRGERQESRERTSPEVTSDYTDYTSHPPLRQSRTPNRPPSQTASRHRTPPSQEVSSVDRQRRSRSADLRHPNTSSVTQLEPSPNTQESPHIQVERVLRNIRGLPQSQTASRQEATHSNTPQALPLMSQQDTVGRSAVSQRPTTQQSATQASDTRALADPNHLQQTQQHRAAPIQTAPRGPGTQTQPVTHSASQPRQGGTVPVHNPSAQTNRSNLTQAALKAHTEKAQTFPNRKQQTQAALLHPGPQTQTPAAAGAQRPPTPPPAIPLAQFQTLPKERTQHRSPARNQQPPRPPVNMPVAQRHLHTHQRPNPHRHHPATMPAKHHHHPGNGHMHVGAQRHAHGHGHPAHFTHPWQHQTHRGRPR